MVIGDGGVFSWNGLHNLCSITTSTTTTSPAPGNVILLPWSDPCELKQCESSEKVKQHCCRNLHYWWNRFNLHHPHYSPSQLINTSCVWPWRHPLHQKKRNVRYSGINTKAFFKEVEIFERKIFFLFKNHKNSTEI